MLKLRWPAACRTCGCELPAGTLAEWDGGERTVRCVTCRNATPQPTRELPAGGSAELDRGRPGASVAREYRRRRRNREARTRAAHPLIGGLLLTLGGTPQHEAAFHQGELGERAVAAALEQRAAHGPAVVLHDRRMPRGRGNIDHLAVAPAGVFVIDAKNIHGKVRVVTPLFGGQQLMISGRDRTKLIDGLDRQVYAVRGALASSGHVDVPVQGVLCFTSTDLPLLGTLRMRGHLLLHRRALGKRLSASGPLDQPAIETLARTLASALPPA